MKFSFKISRTEEARDRRLSYVIAWMLMGLFLTNAVAIGGEVLVITTEMMSLINKVILLFLIILNLNTLCNRIKENQIFYILGMLTLFVINYLIFANEREYQLVLIFTYFITILPVVVILSCIRDYQILLDIMVKMSVAILILSGLCLLIDSTVGAGYTYSMGYANSLIIPICCMIYLYFEKRKFIFIILAIIGGLNISILGSRGALLAIGVYFITQLMKRVNTLENRNRVLVLSMLIIFCLIFFRPILGLIEFILAQNGFSSRTIELLLNDFMHSSGRGIIYEAIKQEIKLQPFVIRGIGGEYHVTGGFYAHNFILEILCDFGVIVGGILLIIVFIGIIRTLTLKEDNGKCSVATLFFSCAIPILLISESIWQSVYFWLWGAMIVSIALKERRFPRSICRD